MSVSNKIVITTGGSGGHIFPGLAVADDLAANGIDVLLIGDMCLDKYKNQIHVPYYAIPTGKTKNMKSIFSILKAFYKSFKILWSEKPSLVIGFGSYASFPTLLAARILRIKVILHEQNVVLGKVNAWFAKYASKILTSFPEIYNFNIENADKIAYVGNPLRRQISGIANFEYKYPDFDKGEKFNIFILAGSGGASFFGNEFLQCFKALDSSLKKKIHIIQQVRQEDLIKTKEFYVANNITNEVKVFFDNVNEQYRRANLVICRSGSTTMFELFSLGLPTIFIPSPHVVNNHQYINAKLVSDKKACILVEEADFNPRSFSQLLINLIHDEVLLRGLANGIKKFAKLDANSLITKLVKEVLNDESEKSKKI